jgi:hypothetical protein
VRQQHRVPASLHLVLELGTVHDPSCTCSYLFGAWHRQCCGAVICRCGGGDEDADGRGATQRSAARRSRVQQPTDDIRQPLLSEGPEGQSRCAVGGVSTGALLQFPVYPQALVCATFSYRC